MRRTAMASGGMEDERLQLFATLIRVCELQAGMPASDILKHADSPDSDQAWRDGVALAEAFLKKAPDPLSSRKSVAEVMGR